MDKSTQSPLVRINRVMKFYLSRGICKESTVRVYRKIINERLTIKN